MVILEALVLRLPIVTVEFASAKNALPAGSGHGRRRRRDEGVADGMRAFLRGDVPASHFDYHAYNRKAVAEFYRAIGASTPALSDSCPAPRARHRVRKLHVPRRIGAICGLDGAARRGLGAGRRSRRGRGPRGSSP